MLVAKCERVYKINSFTHKSFSGDFFVSDLWGESPQKRQGWENIESDLVQLLTESSQKRDTFGEDVGARIEVRNIT